jgi:hypothetical protein
MSGQKDPTFDSKNSLTKAGLMKTLRPRGSKGSLRRPLDRYHECPRSPPAIRHATGYGKPLRRRDFLTVTDHRHRSPSSEARYAEPKGPALISQRIKFH